MSTHLIGLLLASIALHDHPAVGLLLLLQVAFYGIAVACRDISFSVHEGELVAFLGPNGAGKSTTMKLLTGYLAASEGHARIAGHDMSSDRIAGSARLGYLPENGPLYPDMTPHSLISFFADARGMDEARRNGFPATCLHPGESQTYCFHAQTG